MRQHPLALRRLRASTTLARGGASIALLAVLFAACSANEGAPSSTTGETGGSANTGGAGSGGGGLGGAGGDTTPVEDGPPRWLSETGLYAADGVTLAEGVELFTPRFPLWTDGAAKRRWIWLPPGTRIDTTDPDRWQFPEGTRLWKEFTRDDVRVETRLLERRPGGSWWMVAYQWNAEQTDAEARPAGVQNASGTDHDIPSSEDCRGCHVQSAARVLGFGALQLNHGDAGVTLAELIAEDLLTEPPETLPEPPGTEAERALLGALHANCGHCHQPTSSVSFRTDLQLWLPLAQLDGDLEGTPFHQTAVGVDVNLPESSPGGATVRIAPGDSGASALYLRVIDEYRGTSSQMPPLGTEQADDSLVTSLAAYIDGLD